MPIRVSTPLSSPDVYISGKPGIACDLGADVAAQRMKARYLYIRLSKRMSENEETYQLHISRSHWGAQDCVWQEITSVIMWANCLAALTRI